MGNTWPSGRRRSHIEILKIFASITALVVEHRLHYPPRTSSCILGYGTHPGMGSALKNLKKNEQCPLTFVARQNSSAFKEAERPEKSAAHGRGEENSAKTTTQ
jgi:hypothetical protein